MNEIHPLEDEIVHRVQQALNQEIREIASHDWEDDLVLRVVSCDAEGMVQVRIQGCSSCPSSLISLILALEANIRNQVPEMRHLEIVS